MHLLLAGLSSAAWTAFFSGALLALTVALFLAFVFLYLKNRSDDPPEG